MPLFLPALFFCIALVYAMIGFGGGSTYAAVMALAEIDHRLLPVIALSCNLMVVSGGVLRFARSNHLRLKRIAPFVLAALPTAWLGGQAALNETSFNLVLGVGLVGSAMALVAPSARRREVTRSVPLPISILAGAMIGGVSGLVGIGGGVFLAPLLYLLHWGRPKEIAAACSLFILTSSAAGLTGHLMRLQDQELLPQLLDWWPVLVAVLIGGQIGSWAASTRLPDQWIKRLTALLVLVVGLRLLWGLL